MEQATFAAGCFWGVEAAFQKVLGVKETTVGYTGGHSEAPTYEKVCAGATGHAEAVLVRFDSSEVSYEDLLEVFWRIHDPTTLNRQGPDIGDQYRSAVFYENTQQQTAAIHSLSERQKLIGKTIVTEIKPSGPFYRAEDYHQQYLQKRGRGLCHI